MSYSIAPRSRLDYIQKFAPDKLDTANLALVFKRDIAVDTIVEKLYDVNLYYIESNQARGDELYYFLKNNQLFHGEQVWSKFHPFVPHLHEIPPSAEIADSSWFVGSRNNYTHQLVDFLPNLIYRMFSTEPYISSSYINIFGKTNAILRSVASIPLMRSGLDLPSMFLSQYGNPVEYGPWRIRCIRFRELYLIKHLSIFNSFSLLDKIFAQPNQHCCETDFPAVQTERFLYLSRPDNRIINQPQIIDFLADQLQCMILEGIHKLSFSEKQRIISGYSHIILPPGSDNINALCFSHSQSVLFQMIPVNIEQMLESPFTSYACLRYLLPFLHRIVFLPCDTNGQSDDINSGKWSIDKLRKFIMRHRYVNDTPQ